MLLRVLDRLVGPLELKQKCLLCGPLDADLGVGVRPAMVMALAHVHMIVSLLDCVILSLPASYWPCGMIPFSHYP